MESHARVFAQRTITFLCTLTALCVSSSPAQRGRWVEHPLPSGSGGGLYQCGDRLAVYAVVQGNICLFYDGQRGHWTEVDVGTSQHFREVLANGDVALARSDSILVAYSALSGTWDTVRVRGSYINPAAVVSYRLAAAATNEMLYVFDSWDGAWHERAYTLPPDFAYNGLLRAADDYALLILVQQNALTTHIVYSFPQHAFNSIERMPSALPMDGGYVAVTYDDATATLLGYCAEKNQYSLKSLTRQQWSACSYACREITGTSCGFMWTEAPAPDSRVDHFYCYDTRIGGEWYYATRSWDPQYEGSTMACAGDRYVIFPCGHKVGAEEAAVSYIIYSGYTGGYVTRPDRTLWTPNMTFVYGSRCFLSVDSLKVWAYDATNGEEKFLMVYRNWQVWNVENHRDYSLFILRDPNVGPTMGVYAYSSVAHKFTTIDLPAQWFAYMPAGHSALLMDPGYNPPRIIFYSGQVGNFEQATFSSGLYPASTGKDYLATSFLGTEGYLFDAVSGSLQSIPAEFGRSKLGTSSFIYWDGSRVGHGYNLRSRQWATVQMDADGYTQYVTDWIGLLPSYMGPTAFGKYYAYNGLYDCWVPLVPEGRYVGDMLGNRIALVVRSTKLYAFDPELATEVSFEDQVPLVWRLEQNYPNPFNPTTVVRYHLPASGQAGLPVVSNVKLVVYDVLGREVSVLVNDRKAAGSYEVEFDASGLASGMYVYRLTAGTASLSKKMMVMK